MSSKMVEGKKGTREEENSQISEQVKHYHIKFCLIETTLPKSHQRRILDSQKSMPQPCTKHVIEMMHCDIF
ncbi:hypothetical protein EGR_08295 [Echinococcus granulosus]|uniref:Uncharacterized protein n=1 Tax=Echinococcus granulosus TaxID=6210 RepID=W6U8Q8_ECHGR|nr:hypothetical protein EGR_08295 [Echinococcus granulosus]EUB56826.1 hypothetical protein EGR_08295 [Echinococcus granulosus]